MKVKITAAELFRIFDRAMGGNYETKVTEITIDEQEPVTRPIQKDCSGC